MSIAARLPAVARAGPATSAETRCRHCGTALRPRQNQFCCGGCAAAFEFIQEIGLGRYYAGRALDPNRRPPRPDRARGDESGQEWASSVVSAVDGRQTLTLTVDGLHCAACVWLIEQALIRDPSVIAARVNLTSGHLSLTWTGVAQDAGRLRAIVERLGYRAIPCQPGTQTGVSRDERALLKCLAVAGFAAANVMLLSVAVWAGGDGGMGPATRDLMHWVSALIALPAIAYAGQPFFRSAIAALRALRTNMDVPISIGVTAAAALSLWETARSAPHAYFESPIMLLFFLLIGRYLDRRARGQARSTAERLIALSAAPVTRIDDDGKTCRVAATAIRIGDTVLVGKGERIGVDGRIVVGHSSVDQSLIDGESLPRPISPDSPVLAGMINLDSPIRIVVEATGAGTFLAEVARLMEAAERGRARLVMLADRVARRYAPAVHLLSLSTLIVWASIGSWQTAVLNAVTVLVITCPCALGLAVPVVQVIASNRLFARGILLKSGTALERLTDIDSVAFDKTGTLTRARLVLNPDPHRSSADLAAAATLAAVSRHPLSRALCRAAPDVAPADGVQEIPGGGLVWPTAAGSIRLGSRAFCGVTSALESPEAELWLARPELPPCRFGFSDDLRPDAATAIAQLKDWELRLLVLSGDRAPAVAVVADALGIADARSELTPADKCSALQALAARGRKTFMIGDGLNDAAALAAAHVSMSPASAADLSQTAADIVFQGASLNAVPEVLRVARRAARLVTQNIAFAIGYNVVAVPVAMLGHATPQVAALAMSLSSIVVVLNALRLSRCSGERRA